MSSIVAIGSPPAEKRAPAIGLALHGAEAGRPALGERRAVARAEPAGPRPRRRFPGALDTEGAPQRHITALAPALAPAPAPLGARRQAAAPLPYTSPFMAQVIAQEIMPREAREEPNFTAEGIAAYEATAARAAIYLGPQESLRLVA